MLWEYNLWVFATKDVMVQNYRNWHWVAIDFLAKELIISRFFLSPHATTEWEAIPSTLQEQDSLKKYLYFKVTYCGWTRHLEAKDICKWPWE